MPVSPASLSAIEDFFGDLSTVDQDAQTHWFSYIAVKHRNQMVLLAGRLVINGNEPPADLPNIDTPMVQAGAVDLATTGTSPRQLLDMLLEGSLELGGLHLEFPPQESSPHMIFHLRDVHYAQGARQVENALQISGPQKYDVLDYVAVDNALHACAGFHGNLIRLLSAYGFKTDFGATGVWLVSPAVVQMTDLSRLADADRATITLKARGGFDTEQVSLGVRHLDGPKAGQVLTLTSHDIQWNEGEPIQFGVVSIGWIAGAEIEITVIYDGRMQELFRTAFRDDITETGPTIKNEARPRAPRQTVSQSENAPRSPKTTSKKRTRDDFTARVKRALANRAGLICSMPGCGQRTVGPSDESPDASMSIGVASHICAAAEGPGARRYDPNMTPEMRSSIDNGIWLCQKCSVIIDRDEVYYTAPKLREIKADHEAACRLHPDVKQNAKARSSSSYDLIAFGPGLVARGTVTGSGGNGLQLRLFEFVEGTEAGLLEWASDFDQVARLDRYVLLNELGYGRMLSAAPDIARGDGDVCVTFKPDAAPARRVAGSLKTLCRHTLQTLDGIPAFQQDLETTLGSALGESRFAPFWGSRIASYYHRYNDTPAFDEMVKLELIRLATVALPNIAGSESHIPLSPVVAVKSVRVDPNMADGRRLSAHVALLLEGVGEWSAKISLFIHSPSELAAIRTQPPLPGLEYRPRPDPKYLG